VASLSQALEPEQHWLINVIDTDGYRPNVGLIICNGTGKLLWAKRVGQEAWQFPQGGIQRHETPEAAMLRELNEEVGLEPADVSILARTSNWLHYKLPPHLVRHKSNPVCIGQKQLWFLLRLADNGSEKIRFDRCAKPEFDAVRWIDYWTAADEVVAFKREVYRKALQELETTYRQLLELNAPAAN
jgi:putative (di)nucleoside polyphosphate hydrolase